jgi:hypothetical protein
MKNLAILSMLSFLIFTWDRLYAQEVKKEQVKTEIKNDKQEIKSMRKELRKLEGSEVSAASVNAFSNDFGNTPNVRWNRGVYMDEATFKKDGKEIKAYYDFDSKLVGTISIKTFANLPTKAQNEIKNKYKDFTIEKVLFFNDNEGNDTDMMIFETQFEDTDCYFVEMIKAGETIILQVGTEGDVSVLKKI